MIYAGKPDEVRRSSGQWIFVDIGFSRSAKSCGLLIDDGEPVVLTYSELSVQLVKLLETGTGPVNLMIEAPLSVAFNSRGNPTGRSVERRGAKTRYWYVGLGCAVLVAATYLLRTLHDAKIEREIRLFEGFVSFKTGARVGSHADDVRGLRAVVWNAVNSAGSIIHPDQLLASADDTLESAFKVAGLDFGIPPVIVVCG